jgi:hypothetical protein
MFLDWWRSKRQYLLGLWEDDQISSHLVLYNMYFMTSLPHQKVYYEYRKTSWVSNPFWEKPLKLTAWKSGIFEKTIPFRNPGDVRHWISIAIRLGFGIDCGCFLFKLLRKGATSWDYYYCLSLPFTPGFVPFLFSFLSKYKPANAINYRARLAIISRDKPKIVDAITCVVLAPLASHQRSSFFFWWFPVFSAGHYLRHFCSATINQF